MNYSKRFCNGRGKTFDVLLQKNFFFFFFLSCNEIRVFLRLEKGKMG